MQIDTLYALAYPVWEMSIIAQLWLTASIFGGLWFLWLFARLKPHAWWVAIGASCSYLLFNIVHGFMVEALWAVLYFFACIYGQYRSMKSQKLCDKWTFQEHCIFLGTGGLVLLALVAHAVAQNLSATGYLSAFISLVVVVALVMSARRVLGHWVYWVVIGTLGTTLHAFYGNYTIVLLMGALAGLSVYGYFQWMQAWKLEQGEELWARDQL
ncbi:nicotinamide mononucleotide transporter family protein [Persicobacter psychrovividus]|uniref:Nicotinamide riboside transporter PnuC n=1 Tax=Persicobacter psychrovividus TaxID=387638 RepID=A0ABM7VA07_9BACT|nr:hypothetical protein PEPS_00400 [Persicobacter psychrovividus]